MNAARVSRNIRTRIVVCVLGLVIGVAGLIAQTRARTLDIYFIDTEGGQSTLYVGPTGESLLVDSGNAGDRDLGRILEALKAAGVRQIDHMWSTHYHGDHVGALVALAGQLPIGHFYDHGAPHPNDRIVSKAFLASYEDLSRGKRTTVKPGDKVRMAGLDITTVASANQFVRANLRGGGRPNAACATSRPMDESGYIDPDNGESAGFVMAYGRFRTINLGDLTWNGELDADVPDQSHRDGRRLPDLAPWAGEVRVSRAGPCARAAGRGDEQRHPQRRRTRRVPRAARIAGTGGSVAAALVP